MFGRKRKRKENTSVRRQDFKQFRFRAAALSWGPRVHSPYPRYGRDGQTDAVMEVGAALGSQAGSVPRTPTQHTPCTVGSPPISDNHETTQPTWPTCPAPQLVADPQIHTCSTSDSLTGTHAFIP